MELTVIDIRGQDHHLHGADVEGIREISIKDRFTTYPGLVVTLRTGEEITTWITRGDVAYVMLRDILDGRG